MAEGEALFERMRAGDVVIADYHLDTRNTGLDMLMRLRERVGFDVPGIILTGDLPSMLRSIKTEIPNCRFLGKPVDTAALIGAITELSS
jgi:FixJ family two-component response regulator